MNVQFSRRERTILRLLIQGAGPKQIASWFEISSVTAYTHVRNLYRKAGVAGVPQLIIYAMQQPWSMRQGASCSRGIHPPASMCPCPYCQAVAIAA